MAYSKWRDGFTLIEMIMYLAIVSVLLVSISYLMIDIINGQTKSNAGEEVNYTIRTLSRRLTQDIKSAQSIFSLSTSNVVLTTPGGTITYNFDVVNFRLTRQLGSAAVVKLNNDTVAVTGAFTDLSASSRSSNVGVRLTAEFKNLNNVQALVASSTVNFAVELRGRR